MSDPFVPVRAGIRLGPRPERVSETVSSKLEAYLQGRFAARQRGARSFKAFYPTLRQIRSKVDLHRQSNELDRLRQRRELRTSLARQSVTIELAIDAFAHITVECQAVLRIELHDEQLYAGWQMLHGCLVEMRTGEGKTLAAALPAITAALTGTLVHVITANDYLATRDCKTLDKLYQRFGLSVSSVCGTLREEERRQAYACDIVHGSHQQFVFDYLRDSRKLQQHRGGLAERLQTLVAGPIQQPLMRGLGLAIIDEADSVLIDDVRTPLVLSEPLEGKAKHRSQAAVALAIARTLEEDIDFRLAAGDRSIQLSDRGLDTLRAKTSSLSGVWRFERYRLELVRQALTALHRYQIDRDYLVQDDQVVLIDDSTGRPMADRKLRQGLHQMLEVKENCQLSDRTEVVASISFQQFFGRYHRLSGMSGTLCEVRRELRTVYGLPVVSVPTHRPCLLEQRPARYLHSRDEQFACLLDRVEDCQQRERPVLIGTRTLELSEQVSQLLAKAGIEHELLNARQDEEEAVIIAAAGQPGAVTVATNIAGRGSDIPLHLRSRAAGGLHVINLELNESARIDRQLYGRAARQGDPGSCEKLLSLGDTTLKMQLSESILFAGQELFTRSGKFGSMAPNQVVGAFLFWFARHRMATSDKHARMELFCKREQQARQFAVGGE